MQHRPIDIIGWLSSIVLLATLLHQAFTQWRTRSATGISRWLFAGQMTASLGYATYSALLHSWILLSSNVAILVTALVWQFICTNYPTVLSELRRAGQMTGFRRIDFIDAVWRIQS